MSEKAGFENQPPAYSQTAGYPPQAGGYPPPAGAYPPQGQPYGQPVQPGYNQPMPYGQNTTTSTVVVTQPGHTGVVHTYARPPDYMVASIFACLCCFWPTGLCAIYYASQANSAAAAGDMTTAVRMSNNARNLMISSIVIGVIWITLVIVLRVVVYSNYYSRY